MPSLDTIAAYIRARLPEPPTPGEIAAHFGISRFALSRMFRAETGLSLREYIAALKIEQGIPALVAGESIIDSQLESGHASAATFSHRFRKHTGLAPRDYRREALALGSTIEEEMGNPRSRAISYRRFSNEQYRLPHPLDVHIEGRSARGVVFLGLYAEPIPRGAPLQGIALFHGNHARIDAMPPGQCFLLACELTPSPNPLDYFHLNHCLRAVWPNPLNFPLAEPLKLTLPLRPFEPSDPPITVNLPRLLADVLRGGRGDRRNP